MNQNVQNEKMNRTIPTHILKPQIQVKEVMELLENPQTLLEKQRLYLQQVQQFYKQIETWGKGQFEFTALTHYPINDITGDYQAEALVVLKKNAHGSKENLVKFFPHGITFLTGNGVIEMQGPFGEEEVIYIQKENLMYTERHGQECPMYEGFEGDGWYWLVTDKANAWLRRFAKAEFLELVRIGTGQENFYELI